MTPSRIAPRRLRSRLAAAAFGLLCALPAAAQAGEVGPGLESRLTGMSGEDRVPVLVTLREQAEPTVATDSPGEVLAEMREVAGRTQPAVTRLAGGAADRFWLVNALALEATPAQVRRIAAHSAVSRVELDRPVAAAAAQIQSTPYSSAGAVWGVAAVGAPAIWSGRGLDGSGVLIGSIDTGVDAGHAELRGKVAAWRDFVAGRTTPYDDNGHGTHTIGTMVGGAGGGAPIGVAPGARVAVAKAMDANGVGSSSAIMAAAQWLADPDGNPATADQPAVINNSWSTAARNDSWFRPMVQAWRGLGIVPVFAAGNTGPTAGTIGSPADYPESLAVGSVDQSGEVSAFSSRGPVVWSDADGQGPAAGTPLPKPDLVAPGGGISSSVPGGYLTYSGTSMAAPHVAGAVALIRQAAPGLAPEAVAGLLRATAVDGGAPGPDDAFGAGRLDPAAALTALGVPGAAPAPAPSATAPAAAPRPAARLSRSRLIATRRVAALAARRALALERRVFGRAAAPARTLASGHDLTVTRRIAREALLRAARIEARLSRRAPRRPAAGTRGAVAATPAQLRVIERLSQTALTRVRALERRVAAGSRRG